MIWGEVNSPLFSLGGLMSHDICKIERCANGYEVSMCDPKIVESNKKMKSGPWKDPEVCYVFKSIKEVLKFLKDNLEKALPLDEYASTFDKATEEEDDDE